MEDDVLDLEKQIKRPIPKGVIITAAGVLGTLVSEYYHLKWRFDLKPGANYLYEMNIPEWTYFLIPSSLAVIVIGIAITLYRKEGTSILKSLVVFIGVAILIVISIKLWNTGSLFYPT